MLQDLATLAYNITHTSLNPSAKIVITTRPTPLQDKAFKLLGTKPRLYPVNPSASPNKLSRIKGLRSLGAQSSKVRVSDKVTSVAAVLEFANRAGTAGMHLVAVDSLDDANKAMAVLAKA